MGELFEPAFRVDHVESADGQLIKLVGELDLSTVEDVRRTLQTALGSDGGKPVVVDLSELDFIDSTGIQALLEAHAASNADGGGLVFRSPGDEVARVLRMTKVDETLGIAG